jgi:hypothetical protein
MLNYNLIVKLAKKLDLPESIMSRIYVNNAVAAGVGFVPLVGDVALGKSLRIVDIEHFADEQPFGKPIRVMPICKLFTDLDKTKLTYRIEAFLTKRGQKNLVESVPGSSTSQGYGATATATPTGLMNNHGNAQVTNAEVDQIVADSRRAGTATPPVHGQGWGQQQQQQQPMGYQPRVKQGRQAV